MIAVDAAEKIEAHTVDKPRHATGWAVPLRFARRELRSGLSGFYVFLACIALGVAVIAAVAALADGLTAGLERQGQVLLGGDGRLSRIHQRASAKERAWIDGQGRVSETATLRSIGRVPGKDLQSLISIKAVDLRYPLFGAIKMRGDAGLQAIVSAGQGVVVDPLLLARLDGEIGQTIKIGEAVFKIAGVVEREPDRLVSRVTAGPRVFMSLAQLGQTKLVKPGTLVRWHYAVRYYDGARAGQNGSARAPDFKANVARALPDSGFIVRDRSDPSPQVTRIVGRLHLFLTLLGLAALIVGGIGVANAIATFVDQRRKVIAIYKSLGATAQMISRIFLVQVIGLAILGVMIGLAFGYLVPVLVLLAVGDSLPFVFDVRIAPASALAAAAYGLLVALMFAVWPLARAETVRPGVLFRDTGTNQRNPAWRKGAISSGIALAMLVCVAFFMAGSLKVTASFLAGVFGVLVLFFALGTFAIWLARRVPRPPIAEVALALSNVGAPDGLTRAVVVSLGVGLSLLVTVALLDATFVNELTSRMPANSPNTYVLDIPKNSLGKFRETVKSRQPGAVIADAPMLRGRIVRLKGTRVDQIKAAAEVSWVLNGDRGLTYAAQPPRGSLIVEGDWWPADYSGPPLVSFDAGIAKELGLKLGDTISVNVLGRVVTAKIANLREVNWGSLAINFVMVFSPNTLQGAPHNWLATVRLPKGASLQDEVAVSRAIGKALPSVTAIRVKDAIEAFGSVFEKIMVAVRVAAGVTLLAGALVIAGALATGHRKRVLQTALLKVIGATRRRVITVHVIEFLLLAVIAATAAVVVGTAAAWAIAKFALDMQLVFSSIAVAQIVGLAVGMVLLFGLIGTRQVLAARTVTVLRSG